MTDRDIDKILADPRRAILPHDWPDDARETIQKLALEIVRLRKQVTGHCERIAKQSNQLSRLAEKR